MEVRVLGPLLEAFGAHGVVRLRPLERRLLAALVAARPEPVTSGELAEAVWADRAPPRSASHAVQTHVRRVRQALGDAVVVTVQSSYRLATDVQLDVDAFGRAFDEASALDDPTTALHGWSAALAHWRGDPYPELIDW